MTPTHAHTDSYLKRKKNLTASFTVKEEEKASD